jgi:hypothetical protein
MKCTQIAVMLMVLGGVAVAQGPPQDANRKVEHGGIFVPGWKGVVDDLSAKRGETIENSRLAMDGKNLHVTTGPATTYWNVSDLAKGDYTVSATFREPHYMNLNDHPHPYGIVIGANDMGTENQSFLYCAAYGSGKFIVRGMGPGPFQMNGRTGQENEAVHKAAGKDAEVVQQISMQVKGDTVSCSINGTQVWSASKTDVMASGKLKSTDGAYGIRSAHNTEVEVIDLKLSK